MVDPEAWKIQSAAMRDGDLLIWTVCENPSDYPGKFTVRPHSSRTGTILEFILVADALEAVRELLPPGLYCMARHPTDPSVVVETWM